MKKHILALSIMTALIVTGCQKKSDVETKQEAQVNSPSVTNTSVDIPLIKAAVKAIDSAKTKVCHAASPENEFPTCTHYDLQTISTNVPWIDTYFLEKIKADNKDSFDGKPLVEVTLDPSMPSENQSSASVRYISQNYNLATFEYFSSYYPAGAAHGMYATTYVTFDLAQKKALLLNDILQKDVQTKLKKALYSYNSMWLEDHNVTEKDLNISENFYFDVDGLVLVYSIYELASYAEGESKLRIPYYALDDLVKTEYLLNRPKPTNF